MVIQPLTEKVDRKRFDCGNSELNDWFAKIARQHKERGISSTFVATSNAASVVVMGYYAISLAELVSSDLPSHLSHRLPSRVPVFRLGRLATAVTFRGQRVGELLLFDAIDRVTRISKELGGVCLVVNAKESAVGFYQQYGFEPMADHPNHLFLAL